jgi:DNA polymerase-3 subunit epsilon
MEFVAIDLETANADMSSICQIGVVTYQGGEIVSEWTSLVDPDNFFDDVHTSIHDITESHVNGTPKFPELYPQFKTMFEDTICLSHTHFDRVPVRSDRFILTYYFKHPSEYECDETSE